MNNQNNIRTKVYDLLKNLSEAVKREDSRTIIEQSEIADSINWRGFEAEQKKVESLLLSTPQTN